MLTERAIIAAIDERVESITRRLANGGAENNHNLYCRMVGEIAGLRSAKDLIQDQLKKED